MSSNMKNIVGYIRVSTKKQGQSGLGLEAQQQAIADYLRAHGGKLLASYKEIESGKRSDNRPELARALAHAKRSGATLVVAKLDRLSRNAAFLFALMDSGCDFVACDNPHANRLTIGVLAVVAENEARAISQRTKDALAAYKARGGLLGAARPGFANLSAVDAKRGQLAAVVANRQAAVVAYADLLPTMVAWKQAGLTQQAIADKLNAEGQTTRNGKAWSQVQVMRVLQRAG